MPVLLNSQNSNFEKEFKKLLLAKREDSVDVDVSVREIIGGVIELGDQALIEYTKKFDRVSLTPDTLRFTQSELKEQAAQVSDCLLYTSPSPRDISGSRMPSSA